METLFSGEFLEIVSMLGEALVETFYLWSSSQPQFLIYLDCRWE